MNPRLITAVLLFFLPAGLLTAQPAQPPKQKNIIWFTPNAASRVNGIAVGFQALNIHNDPLTINGLNTSMGFVGFMAVPYDIHNELSSRTKKIAGFLETDTAFTLINGISASMGGEVVVSVNGINLTFGVTGAAQLNGLSVSGVLTRCNTFRGISVSGLRNIAKKGTGIQIALFNTCNKLKGIQIGLWNKSGKRGLPFFNWGF